MADKILIAHANEGGKLEKFAFELLENGKKVWTFERGFNWGLVERGPRILRNSDIINKCLDKT